jgi:hypothetical protein
MTWRQSEQVALIATLLALLLMLYAQVDFYLRNVGG